MKRLDWTSFNKKVDLISYLWNGLIREGSRDIELLKRVHPTQKPVGLIMNILKNYQFNVVYDFFGGSGSTMVAAHKLDKKCYIIEFEPHYIQVIVDRMRKLDPDLVIKKNGEVI